MARFIMVVPSAPKPDCDTEYNRWYDEEHLSDVCAVPGFVAGTRYDAVASSPDVPPAPYLAIYEIDADSPDAAAAELGRRVESGEMAISPAIAIESAKMWIYKAR